MYKHVELSVDLTTLSADVRQYVESLVSENIRLSHEAKLKDEKIRLLNIRLFGPKSEKISPAQTALLFEEASVTAGEVEREAELPEAQKENPQPKARSPRATHPGREKLPEHLERRETVIPCDPKDCRCGKCGAERPVIGYETREELVCEPAKFYVRLVKREKRGSHCEDEQGVATAPAPAQIVPKGKLSNELIIEALAQKYQQHLPVYRQCAAWAEDHGIDLSRSTVTSAVISAGALLEAVVREQVKEMMGGAYLQADETTVPVQTGERSGRNHRAYLWQFSVPAGLVVFDFQMGRGREGPEKFLKNFRGALQCDGYGAYAKLGESIVYVGCMAHVRRGFVDAAKLAPEDPLPREIVETFGRLYAVERAARQGNMDAAGRLALRKERSVPIMAALKPRLVEIRQKLMPGGALAKACDYALGQWSRLEPIFADGMLEIDNNWCEGGMRPVVLGRKNWLHIGRPEAGPKVAAIASIVETCRRLDINLRAYLTDVLPKLGEWPASRVAELTPTAWKAAQKS